MVSLSISFQMEVVKWLRAYKKERGLYNWKAVFGEIMPRVMELHKDGKFLSKSK